MSALLFSNNAKTTLAGTVTIGATTLAVATGTGALFPAPGAGQYFIATLIAASNNALTEIIKVTAVSGDNFTIVRAQEGTTARAWAVGDIIFNGVTAGQMGALAQTADIQSQPGNYAVSVNTNTLTATLAVVPASQAALLGAAIRIKKSAATNTGAVTLNLNSLGAQAVVLATGAALTAGMLPANGIFEVVWDGTNYQLVSVNGVLANAQLALMPDQTFKGNVSGSPAAPSDLSALQVANALPANSITDAQLAQMAGLSVKGNLSGGVANQGDVSVSALASAMGVSKTYAVKCNGTSTPGSATILKQSNFASVTRTGTTGVYSFVFTTAANSADYIVNVTCGGDGTNGTGQSNSVGGILSTAAPTINGFTLRFQSGNANLGGGACDPAIIMVTVTDPA